MNLARRDFLALAGTAAGASLFAGLFSPASAFADRPGLSRGSGLDVNDATLHFLNRISYGVTAADYARAVKMGIPAYLNEQLNPESIKDTMADRVVKKNKLLNADRFSLLKRNGVDQAHNALLLGMLQRAIYSQRQLLERMVEFWSDHFNIHSADLEIDSLQFQRQAIRKYALGNFATLLAATAKEPAMLFFLNNAENVAEHPNENYARELMELHTIGVASGYTEADVKNVARAFTGWTVNDDTAPGGFHFDPDSHDTDEKTVLGNTLLAGRGIEDGQDVLAILANHPAAARFICRKLAVRFVSDTPPQSLIDAMVSTWNQSSGEIKPVLKTLFQSAEFNAAVRLKLRRPLDFYIAALRVTGADLGKIGDADYTLSILSQVPYGWHAPNGYPDVAAAWNNTSGLLSRWNTALSLEIDSGKSHAASALAKSLGHPGTAGQLVDAATQRVFMTTFPDTLRSPLISYITDGGSADSPVTKDILKYKVRVLFGLLLASDLFQWR